MTAGRCAREGELLAALGRGFVGAELAEHVGDCASCHELSTVAGALLDERAAAVVEARVPAAGTMWWRLRLRQRQEAHSRARRSLLVGQAATLALVLGLVIAFFGRDLAHGLGDLIAILTLHRPLLVALVMAVMLVPIGGWVALRQK